MYKLTNKVTNSQINTSLYVQTHIPVHTNSHTWKHCLATGTVDEHQPSVILTDNSKRLEPRKLGNSTLVGIDHTPRD